MLTAARKKFRSDQCGEYHKRSTVCQVSPYVEGLRLNYGLGRYHLHHIFGRSSSVIESDWFCNLVYVEDSIHDLCHGQHKANLTVACLKAKLEMHRWFLLTGGYQDDRPERSHWHPAALDRLCYGGGLSGWIDGKLRPKLTGVFVGYADELLKVLEAGDV